MRILLVCIAYLSLGDCFLLEKRTKLQPPRHDQQQVKKPLVGGQLSRHCNHLDRDCAEDENSGLLYPLVSATIFAVVLSLGAFPSYAEDLLLTSLDPRFFLAGGLCAAASHGVTTPIDVVKTRIQARPRDFQQVQGNVVGAALQIVRQDGATVLLGGLGPTVLGYGLEGAAKFGLYESLKPITSRLLGFDSPAVPYLLASTVAGAVASIILCPMERTRIRLVTEPTFATNLFTGIPRLVEESGIKGLFYGLPAMLSKQVPYTMGKQISFDAFASFLYSVAGTVGLLEESVKFEVACGAAALASVIACIISHPGDVILTASYRSTSSRSFLDTIHVIYEKEGWKGFLSGISARLLHVGVIITSQLVLYDEIKQLLGLPATGSR